MGGGGGAVGVVMFACAGACSPRSHPPHPAKAPKPLPPPVAVCRSPRRRKGVRVGIDFFEDILVPDYALQVRRPRTRLVGDIPLTGPCAG